MTGVLNAWLEGRHVGAFVEDTGGKVTFTYAADAPASPVSLSLPRERPSTRNAARDYLDGLLPDRPEARTWMKEALQAASTSTFDLLSVAGGDLAGGLVLLPEGSQPADLRADLDPADDASIAYRMRQLHTDPDRWFEFSSPARFSLAGSQPKFALAGIHGDWYWSNAALPSTHILKPSAHSMPGLHEAEAAAETLAATIGVTAPRASVLEVLGERAYLIERFDREVSATGIARRLHAEDITQALGISSERKYGVTAKQTVSALLTEQPSGEAAHEFLRQLAFNTVIGNADAHAKNYSIILRPDGISLAPLYDAVPTTLWPHFDRTLAMRIAGATRPPEVSVHHWRKLAADSGLDVDRVVSDVRSVYRGVVEHAETAWDALPSQLRERMLTVLQEHSAHVLAG